MEVNEIYEATKFKVAVFFAVTMYLSGFLSDNLNTNFKWRLFWAIVCILSWIMTILCIFDVNEQFILFLGGMMI